MKKFFKVFLAIFAVLILTSFVLENIAFANENIDKESGQKEDCSPYYLCLEKHNKIDQSNPFEITSVILKEPTPKKEKEKITSNDSTVKKSTIPTNAHPLNSEKLFNLINDYRIKVGLTSFQKEEKVCEVAKSRVNEILNEIFVTGRLHAGFYARNLPFWSTENLVYAQTEERALKWWLSSQVHRSAILGQAKYSCLECTGNSCTQIFTSYTPKQS